MDQPLIAQGATADIYAWGENRVLKLFYPQQSIEVIQREFDNARHAARAGVRTPDAFELLTIEDRPAIVYQRVYGDMVDTMLRRKPWRAGRYMRQMAATLADLHRADIALDLRPLPEVFAARIEKAPLLDSAVKAWLIAHLNRQPGGDSVLHGDYHLRNVMIDSSGAVIIDWPDALRGNPLMDIARSYVILSEDHRDSMPNALLRALYPSIVSWLRDTFVQHYLRITQRDWAEVQPWLPLVAAVRLTENGVPQQQLRAMLDRWMQDLSI
jgi:aminoglycoside phosphotransferase (APT) family kinase protein